MKQKKVKRLEKLKTSKAQVRSCGLGYRLRRRRSVYVLGIIKRHMNEITFRNLNLILKLHNHSNLQLQSAFHKEYRLTNDMNAYKL